MEGFRMFGAALTGILAGIAVFLLKLIRSWFDQSVTHYFWAVALIYSLIGSILLISKRNSNESHSFHGLPNLLASVHSPEKEPSSSRWLIHGFISSLLASFS